MDVFTVTLTGTVIDTPRIIESGTVFFKLMIRNKGKQQMFVEVMARDSAALIARKLCPDTKVLLTDVMGFISAQQNGCHFSVGVRKDSYLHMISVSGFMKGDSPLSEDIFKVTVTGSVKTMLVETENGAIYFKVKTETKSGLALLTEVIAKEEAAEKCKSFLCRHDKICLLNVMGFTSGKKNDCHISVGLNNQEYIHIISHYDGVMDAETILQIT